MPFFKRLIDFFTLGSERPFLRLFAYYVILTLVTIGLVYVFPPANQLFSGERLEELTGGGAQVFQDGLNQGGLEAKLRTGLDMAPRLQLIITTELMIAAVLALMLPV